MPSLADHQELVGFFSYSRDDDEDSQGALSALRDRIQRELRGQLGRSPREFRLWQDKQAIGAGRLWQAEIETAIEQAVFFIPIITPTAVRSEFCRFEFEAFRAREQRLRRNDLIFPILYIRVPGLEDSVRRDADPVLKMIAQRQYVDWRAFRHRDVHSPAIGEAIEHLCTTIVEALTGPQRSEAELERLRRQEEYERAEAARRRQQEEEERREAEAERLRQEKEERARAEAERVWQEKEERDQAAAERVRHDTDSNR